MEDNREDEPLVWITLNAQAAAHYGRRAEAAGRTLEAQLRYELEVCYGGTVHDPGDRKATHHGQLFRRMSKGRILQG